MDLICTFKKFTKKLSETTQTQMLILAEVRCILGYQRTSYLRLVWLYKRLRDSDY